MCGHLFKNNHSIFHRPGVVCNVITNIKRRLHCLLNIKRPGVVIANIKRLSLHNYIAINSLLIYIKTIIKCLKNLLMFLVLLFGCLIQPKQTQPVKITLPTGDSGKTVHSGAN